MNPRKLKLILVIYTVCKIYSHSAWIEKATVVFYTQAKTPTETPHPQKQKQNNNNTHTDFSYLH